MENIKVSKKFIKISAIILSVFLIAILANPFGTSNTSLYLKIKLASERKGIEETIKSRFSFLNSLEIKKLVLLKNNTYLGVTLSYNSVTYRGLMIKSEDNSWSFYALPEIVLNYNDYPEIPRDIIKQINNM